MVLRFNTNAWGILQLHVNALAAVVDSLLACADNLNDKLAVVRHAWVFALATTDGEVFALFCPLKRDGRADAFLVVVAIAFVFIERELCVGSRIDFDGDGVAYLRSCVLSWSCSRND